VPSFSHFKLATLPLGDLQPGSTLEYSVTETRTSWIPGEYWDEIFLEDTDPFPILKERIRIVEREGHEAQVKFFNGNFPAPQVSHEGGSVTKTWELEKLPPFPREVSMPAAVDVVPRMVVSTIHSWDDIVKAMKAKRLTPVGPANL